MSEALKPCPFCGADIAQLREGSDLMWGYCLECRADGPPSLKTGGNSSAIAAWNRRAPSVTRGQIAAAIHAHCTLSRADIAQDVDGAREAADAILALFGGE